MPSRLPETSGAPYAYLPDSGTVDIREERFYQILEDGWLEIDERSDRSVPIQRRACKQSPQSISDETGGEPSEEDRFAKLLRSRGVEVRYDLNEDEWHGFHKRENEVKARREASEFFESHPLSQE